MAHGKFKKKLKGFLQKEKSKFQKVKEKIHDTLKKIHFPNKEERKYMALLPYKPVMKKALQRKGVQFKNNLVDISEKFLQHIVGKRGKISSHLSGHSFVDSVNVSYDENFYYDGTRDYFDFASSDFNVDEEDVEKYTDTAKKAGGIIKRILAWFKERKARKQAEKEAKDTGGAVPKTVVTETGETVAVPAEPLTDDEKDIVDDAKAAEKVVVEAATKEVEKDDMKAEAGLFGFSPIQILLGLVILSVLIGMLRGKSKAA